MKLPFPFNSKEKLETTPSWPPWPSCTNPKTLSFRANSDTIEMVDTSPTSCLTRLSLESESFTSGSGDSVPGAVESIETVIQGLRSTERLFFEPGETNSILEEGKAAAAAAAAADGLLGLKESVVMSMDPFGDFKVSMEEMVEAHGLKDNWEGLEELLGCYLRVNADNNHPYIVAAFVDLLVGLTVDSSSSPSSSVSVSRSTNSPLSFSSSSTSSITTTTTNTTTTPSSSLLEEAEVEIEKTGDSSSSSSSFSSHV